MSCKHDRDRRLDIAITEDRAFVEQMDARVERLVELSNETDQLFERAMNPSPQGTPGLHVVK